MSFFDEVHERYADPVRFVDRVKRALWERRITQRKLAERSGYAPAHVCDWLNGRTKPEMGTMVILDEALESLLKGE